MKEFIKKYWKPLAALAVLIIIVIIYNKYSKSNSGSSTAQLGKCIKDKGAKFYGASWCPHCKNQKALFGGDASSLPYVECSPGSKGTPQLQACTDAGVATYPTWVFADGTKQAGEMTIDQLKQKSGC